MAKQQLVYDFHGHKKRRNPDDEPDTIYDMDPPNKFDGVNYLGVFTPNKFTKKSMNAIRSGFKTHPLDVFIMTYPKCGTTWVSAICYMLGLGKISEVDGQVGVPWIDMEMAGGWITVDQLNQPRTGLQFWKSHMPLNCFPAKEIHPSTRFIFVTRNWKDSTVSNFYQRRKRGYLGTFEQFFNAICEGRSRFGNYIENTLGWWKAHVEKQYNILWLSFEDLKLHTKREIKRIATFLELEPSDSFIDKLVEATSFEKQQANAIIREREGTGVTKTWFYRKGTIGDWRTHMTKKMSARMDNIIKVRLESSGLGHIYDLPIAEEKNEHQKIADFKTTSE